MGGRGARSVSYWGEVGRVSKAVQRQYGNEFAITGYSPMNGVYTVYKDKKRGLLARRFDHSRKGGPIKDESLANIHRFVKDFQNRGKPMKVERLR